MKLILPIYAGVVSYIIMRVYPFTIYIFGGLIALFILVYILTFIIAFIQIIFFDTGYYNYKSGISYQDVNNQIFNELSILDETLTSLMGNTIFTSNKYDIDDYTFNEEDYKL